MLKKLPNIIKIICIGILFFALAYTLFIFLKLSNIHREVLVIFISTFILASFYIMFISIIFRKKENLQKSLFEGYIGFFISTFHFFISLWALFLFNPNYFPNIGKIIKLIISIVGQSFVVIFGSLTVPFFGCVLEYYLYKKTGKRLWKYALIFSIIFILTFILLGFAGGAKRY